MHHHTPDSDSREPTRSCAVLQAGVSNSVCARVRSDGGYTHARHGRRSAKRESRRGTVSMHKQACDEPGSKVDDPDDPNARGAITRTTSVQIVRPSCARATEFTRFRSRGPSPDRPAAALAVHTARPGSKRRSGRTSAPRVPAIACLSGAASRDLLPSSGGFRLGAVNAEGAFPVSLTTRYSGSAVLMTERAITRRAPGRRGAAPSSDLLDSCRCVPSRRMGID